MIPFLTFAAAAVGYSLAMWPVLKRFRLVPVLPGALATVVLATPLVIPADDVGIRAFACVLAIDQWFKMLDYSRCLARNAVVEDDFLRYAAFLIPFPVFQVQYGSRIRRTNSSAIVRDSVRTAMLAGAVFVFAYLLLTVCARLTLLQNVFWIDHVTKLVIFVVAIEALSKCIQSIERLAGYNTEPLVRRIIASRSVADFWRRCNSRVHDWFLHNVFDRVGGFRHPLRGICLTFLLSGLFHELMFGIATSRFDGFQLAFFLLQVPGILLSQTIRRLTNHHRMTGKFLTRAFTLLWLGTTSVLFFSGVDRVFPNFYAGSPVAL